MNGSFLFGEYELLSHNGHSHIAEAGAHKLRLAWIAHNPKAWKEVFPDGVATMQAATKIDWPELRPMPTSYEDMKIELHFNASHMRNLRRGFIPVDQDQKWFLYFEDNILHMHRSWSGTKMYEVLFDANGEGGVARRVRINLGPEYGGTLDDAWETLLDVLKYYASDGAHEPYESGFVTALKEAAQPNYLGSPTVVMNLIAPYFWRIICKELPKHFSGLGALPGYEPTSDNDVQAINNHIASVLCGADRSFYGLENWRTEQGLGKAIVQLVELDADWYAEENLYCIVSEGLAGLSLATAQIITDWANDPPPLNLKTLFRFIGVLREFSVSMLLGTHTVHFPDIRLGDFTWANRSNFVRLDEEVEDCPENSEECAETTKEPREEARQSPSFEELLRQLQAVGEEIEEEDHNPEDDEEFEDEACNGEEALLPGPLVHPRRDEHGKLVKLAHPSTPTALCTWMDAESIATVIPDGTMPSELAGISFAAWREVPQDDTGWKQLADQGLIKEPDFKLPKGKKVAAGVVIVEEDGRVWAVAPSNAFGGHSATFPKGTCDPGLSLQATAIREAYEEAGLQVQLTGFLIDVTRTMSHTRYYFARRIVGHPGDMGWESQAVMLIPVDALPQVLTNKNDAPIIRALQEILR